MALTDTQCKTALCPPERARARYADSGGLYLEVMANGSKPSAEITAPQLLAVAKRIQSRGTLDIAWRSWQTCGQIFEYALAHGGVERIPTKDVRPVQR